MSPSSTPVTELRVFVASPSDVHEERKRLGEVIERINRGDGARNGYRLAPWRWEVDSVPGLGAPQDLINPELDRAAIVVVLFWERFGTPTAIAAAGTEEEYERAYASWSASDDGLPRVMTYFRDVKGGRYSADALRQMVQVAEFRERTSRHGLQGRYADLAEFSEKLHDHLVAAAHDVLDRLAP